MPRKIPKVSPKLEDELRDKLETLLDERDDVAERKRRIAKALKGALTVLDDSVSLVRRQLKGQDLDQLEIPGSEVPAPAKDPVVAEILKLAGGIVERQPETEGDEDEEEPSLSWVSNRAGLRVAGAKGGRYEIEQTASGGWTAAWKPLEGRQKLLVVDKPEAEAREACRAHLLDRSADDLLRDAGDDDLTRKDLKGEPEARKGGRRGA